MALKPKPRTLRGWRSVRRLTSDGAVESEEQAQLEAPVVAHSDGGGRELGRRYWAEVERSTRGLVRLRRTGAGGPDEDIDLRVLGRWPALLVLAPAEIAVSDDEVTCRHAILGGILARSPRGSLTLTQRRAPDPSLRSVIAGFYPRLAARPGKPGWSRPLYGLVQHRLHVWISRRFFRALLEETAR